MTLTRDGGCTFQSIMDLGAIQPSQQFASTVSGISIDRSRCFGVGVGGQDFGEEVVGNLRIAAVSRGGCGDADYAEILKALGL
jgi:hypothetical protein